MNCAQAELQYNTLFIDVRTFYNDPNGELVDVRHTFSLLDVQTFEVGNDEDLPTDKPLTFVVHAMRGGFHIEMKYQKFKELHKRAYIYATVIRTGGNPNEPLINQPV